MDTGSALEAFVCEWADYLRQRDHVITTRVHPLPLLSSRNSRGHTYRWLLLHAPTDRRPITAADREHIRRELAAAGPKASVYVVVKFERPHPKVVALSAARALRARRVQADKGGIPWDD